MNPEHRRSTLQPDNNVPDNRSDGDDEFGEFEGFDGVSLESIPVAAGPSPWATFPDLLPVQTSPASGVTSSEEASGGQPQRAPEPYDAQMWLGGAVGGAPHLVRSAPVALLQHSARHGGEGPIPGAQGVSFLHQISPRTGNPPDVSLSACPSSLPYSALDAELHPSRSSPQHMASSQQSLLQDQLSAMQDQLSRLQEQRAEVEGRLNQVLQQKQDLATRLSQSHSQTAELRIHLQEAQDQLRAQERKSTNCNSHSESDVALSLQQIQESLCTLQDCHQTDRSQIDFLSQQVTELKEATESKMARLEHEVGERHNATEWLTQHMTEMGNTLRTTISATLEEGYRQHTLNTQRLIQESLQGLPSTGAASSSSSFPQLTLDNLKVYFDHCIEQHRQMLENERRQQLRTVSRTLETMLAQLSSGSTSDAPDSTTLTSTESDVGGESTSGNAS